MASANRLHARFRKPEVFDLAFADQVLDRARDLLDRHVGIDAVLILQIDLIALELLERRVGSLDAPRQPKVWDDNLWKEY